MLGPYLDKRSLAAALQIPEDRIDDLVRRGIIPRPTAIGSFVRWRWEDVDLALAGRDGEDNDEADPLLEGARRVATERAKGRRETA